MLAGAAGSGAGGSGAAGSGAGGSGAAGSFPGAGAGVVTASFWLILRTLPVEASPQLGCGWGNALTSLVVTLTDEVAYPPAQHMLRDLRIEFAHGDRESYAWIPNVGELADGRGHVRLGAISVLADVLGGGLAALAAAPGWIATADLTVHRGDPIRAGSGDDLEAHGRVVRAGRSTVVLECRVRAGAGSPALATLTFAVLERRDSNPEFVPTSGPPIRQSMATDTSGLRVGVAEAFGIVVLASGEARLAITPYVVNSLGATQGGALATLAELAAESLDPSGRSASVDLQLSYLSLAKVGPVVATAQRCGDEGVVRVVLVDAGAQRTVAHAMVRIERVA